MGKKDRQRSNRHVLGPSYRSRCLYCGDPAEVRDHYRPWRSNWTPHVLPACRACNGTLASEAPRFLGERSEHVYRRLRHRFRKDLEADWDERIASTTGRLRDALTGMRDQTRHLEARLDWLTTTGGAFMGIDVHEVHLPSVRDRIQSLLAMLYRTSQ